MSTLTSAVGSGSPNVAADVTTVQTLLVRHRQWLAPNGPPTITGRFDDTTAKAILAFQANAAALVPPIQNGIVAPGGFTLGRLDLALIEGPRHRIFLDVCWAHGDPDFTAETYAAAAATLGCEAAAVEAVARVETKKAAWDEFGRPTILFERHKFSKHTSGRFDATHPDISAKSMGGWGPSRKQYDRLRRAAMLDETAALKSASWGIFQIMGENHAQAGYASVEAFVDGLMASKQAHLNAFVAFVQADPHLLKALRDKKWARFASGYNGQKYRGVHPPYYDEQMADAYKAASPPSSPAASHPAPLPQAGTGIR